MYFLSLVGLSDQTDCTSQEDNGDKKLDYYGLLRVVLEFAFVHGSI